MNETFLAIDLGAESGRVIAIQLPGTGLTFTEIHRFANQPIVLPTGWHWDIAGLWREIVVGLSKAADWSNANGVSVASVGVDAWGVDWALLTEGGELIGLPHAYRDPRNPAACEQALKLVSAEQIYSITGIQLMPINSIFSLYAQRLADPSVFDSAARLMFIPDLFHYWLSGQVTVETTIASTSQLIDVHRRDWAEGLIERLGLPRGMFGSLAEPGTIIGGIHSSLAKQTGLSEGVRVILPPAHDTASAVAAVPADSASSWCFLSSGTWSLLGAEIEQPCLSDRARETMFTNEWGVGSRVRFLKNIAGLWLIQELRRDLADTGVSFDYSQLTELAANSTPFRSVVDANHSSFQTPGGICKKIVALCRRSNQPLPQTAGEFARCCLESLAVAYRRTFAKLREVLGRDFNVVHIVGGGGQNRLLCQMTADALERTVVVGPYEATALGNGLVQAMALGRLSDLAALRARVANSTPLETYQPNPEARWGEWEECSGRD